MEGNILTFGEDTKNKNSSFPRIFPINFEMKTRKKRDIFDDLRQAWINCGRWMADIWVLINLIAYFGIFVYLCYIL